MKTMKTMLFAVLMLPLVAAADMKIAVIDPMQAIVESEEVKSRNARLEASLEEESQRLRRLRDDVAKIEERLQRDGMTMSRDERNKLTDEGETKTMEFQALQQTLQRRVNTDRQDLLESMEPKVLRAIEEIAGEMGLDMVISAQAAVYVKPELDITKQVTQRINRIK
ncbi:OmpH family outer membrane protein [Alcanivorax quisquiliarum]|uniref:OmpH family outer membrane protein n=1 Tax=Alcanivorax quisquiliarum TaxID=2933565 RepID=A0ABT0E741_9GAMM|nr:OmpH family outer membrane protein [Alcanivorax quisquiliarum]MCK0537650.1 OmpH family outer membrane protein [Alcanivorax quisquiliarum]